MGEVQKKDFNGADLRKLIKEDPENAYYYTTCLDEIDYSSLNIEGKTPEELYAIGNDYLPTWIYTEDGIVKNKGSDSELAGKYLKAAADLGCIDAIYKLAENLTEEKNYPFYSRALYWYKKAGELGYAYANYKVGEFYKEGLSVEQDINEAVKWFELAAIDGSKSGFNALCDILKNNIENEKEDFPSIERMAFIICKMYSLDINEKDIIFNKETLGALKNRLLEIAAYENSDDSDDLDLCNNNMFRLSKSLKDDDDPALKLALMMRDDKVHYEICKKILMFLLKINDTDELNNDINSAGKMLILESGKLTDSNLDSCYIKLFIAEILGSFASEGEDLKSLSKEWENNKEFSKEKLSMLYLNRGDIYLKHKNADAAIADFKTTFSYAKDEDKKGVLKYLRSAYKLKQSTQLFSERMADYRQIIEKFKDNYEIVKLQTREEKAELAASLALFEEYELLEKLLEDRGDRQSKAFNKNILNYYVSPKFSSFQPTPVYFVSTKEAWQVMKDPKKMLKYLADKGADLDERAGDRSTAVWYQTKKDGSPEILQTLLELGADPNLYSFNDELQLGSWNPLPYCLTMNYNKAEKVNYPFDEEAIKRAKILLEHGADPNRTNANIDEPPLMMIFDYGFIHDDEPIAGKPAEGILEFIEFIISKGADVNFFTWGGNTPLESVKKYNLSDVEAILLKHGALPLSENPNKIFRDAQCLTYGDTIDYNKALELFIKAGNAGCEDAFNYAGMIYYHGEEYRECCNIKKDRAKAFELFKKATERENYTQSYFYYESIYYLGLMYFNGDNVKQDYETAFSYFVKAMDSKEDDLWAALECIDIMLEKGLVKNCKYKSGAEWYLASDCNGRTADCLAKFSIVHYKNTFVEDIFDYRDYSYGDKFLLSLPECSKLKSQFDYNKEDKDSEPLFDEVNYEKGIFWLDIAAQKGYKDAFKKLCLFYKRNKENDINKVPSAQGIAITAAKLYQIEKTNGESSDTLEKRIQEITEYIKREGLPVIPAILKDNDNTALKIAFLMLLENIHTDTIIDVLQHLETDVSARQVIMEGIKTISGGMEDE